MVVFWVVTLCILVLGNGVSEEYAATICMVVVGKTRMESFSIGRR
jgi:hypothetical protein